MMRLGRSDRAVARALAAGAVFVGTLAGATLTAGTATADLNDDKAKVERQLDVAKDDLDDTSAELRKAYADLADTRSQVPAAQNALAAAQTEQADADARNQQAIADLAIAEADEERALSELADTRTELSDTRSSVAGFAAQLYQEQGSGALAIALEATDPQQLADRMAMADTVMDLQQGALSRLNTQSASLTATQDHLSALRDRSAAAQVRTEQTLAEAAAATQRAAEAKATLDALVARQAALTDGLEGERVKEQARIDDLNAESDRIKDKLAAIAAEEARQRKAELERQRREAARASRTKTPATTSGSAAPPVAPQAASGGFLSSPSAGWISSEFGWRQHPILNYARLHSGRDYAAGCGTPVYAAAPGSVVSAGWAGGYGNQVVLSHGLQRGVGLATTYNHLSAILVHSGSVARGALVGYVGTTGLSTGCHLHFETRENGAPVDPRGWL